MVKRNGLQKLRWKIKYQKEAQLIHKALKDGNSYLAKRLERKINEYAKFIEQNNEVV